MSYNIQIKFPEGYELVDMKKSRYVRDGDLVYDFERLRWEQGQDSWYGYKDHRDNLLVIRKKEVDKDWTNKALKTCQEAADTLEKYYQDLTAQAEKCLELAKQLRNKDNGK